MTHPATELRTTLRLAAGTARLANASDAGRAPATDRQIDMIVALARGSNNYDVGVDARLTSRDASRIITSMMDAGAEPDHNVTEEELDDQDAAEAEAKAAAVSRKAAKKQREADKARRDAVALEAARAAATGQRVRHAKFGEGDVIAFDAATVTAIFAGQRKPLKLGRSFVEFI